MHKDQPGLFDGKSFRGENNDTPWKRSDVDKLFEEYFLKGTHPSRIALLLNRTPESIRTKIKEYKENLFNRTVRYRPKKRTWRGEMRMTVNDEEYIEFWVKRGLPLEHLARLLQRPLKQLQPNKRTRVLADVKNIRKFVASLDLIWALRYAYFVWAKKDEEKALVPDAEYDEMVQEEIEYGGGLKAFATIKSQQGWPSHIKSLALYLAEKPK